MRGVNPFSRLGINQPGVAAKSACLIKKVINS